MVVENIELKVNESSLIDKFRFAFTNKTTVLSELMQNARRAGATFVRFDHNEEANTLTVTDNGCGLKNFQDLLTIGDSGWTEEVCREEQAFGMGFLSALYSAEVISITSCGQKTRFAPKEIISKAMAQVLKAEDDGLTTILMEGIKLSSKDLHQSLKQNAMGFPIEVFFQEESLPRPHAQTGNLTFEATEIGAVCLKGIHHGEKGRFSGDTRAYLQGLLVYKEGGIFTKKSNIVHLDSSKFSARLPDRDCLIDAKDKKKEIEAFIESFWVSFLAESLAQKDPLEFLKIYEEATFCYAKELFCQIPYLPTKTLAKIDGYPSSNEHADFLEPCDDLYITRNEVEKESISICVHPGHLGCNGETALQWMYAAHSNMILCNIARLPLEHWARPFILDLDYEMDSAKVVVNTPGKSGEFSGVWAGGKVTLCESYSISPESLPTVTIDDEAIYTSSTGYLIPAKSNSSEVICQQVDYNDEYGFLEEDKYDEDWDELSAFIKSLRCDDPAEVLRSLILNNISTGRYDSLMGKTFSLSFNEKGVPSVILA